MVLPTSGRKQEQIFKQGLGEVYQMLLSPKGGRGLKTFSEQTFCKVWKARVEEYVRRETAGMVPEWLSG